MKAKILADEFGEYLFCLDCVEEKEGLEYELYSTSSNSNQPEMFCADCHSFLGFDRNIQISSTRSFNKETP